MSSKLRLLSTDETLAVQGGSMLFAMLEIPHILMGLREFINFSIERAQYGCDNVDDNDHLTLSICHYLGSPNAPK